MRVIVVCVNSYFSYSVNTSFLLLIFWKKKVLIPLFVIVISNILIVFTNKNITKIMLSLYVLHILQSFAASLEKKIQLWQNNFILIGLHILLHMSDFQILCNFFCCLNMSEKIHLNFMHNQQWLQGKYFPVSA